MKKKLVCALVVLAAFTIAACDNGGNKQLINGMLATRV